jgi:hypothetical protein
VTVDNSSGGIVEKAETPSYNDPNHFGAISKGGASVTTITIFLFPWRESTVEA